MRHDEHGWDPKGPATVHQLRGGLDANGEIVGWDHEAWIPAFFETTIIGSVLAGRAARMPSIHLWEDPILYDIPASRQLAHYQGDIGSTENDGVGLISAWIRSPVQLQATFASESFFDELAAAAGADPVELRLKGLKDPRMIAVLQGGGTRGQVGDPPVSAPERARGIRRRARPRRRDLAAWRHLQRRGRRGRGRPRDRQDPRRPHDHGPGQRHDDQPAGAQARDRSQRRPDGQPRADRGGQVRPLERHQLRLGRLPDHPLHGRADGRRDLDRPAEPARHGLRRAVVQSDRPRDRQRRLRRRRRPPPQPADDARPGQSGPRRSAR